MKKLFIILLATMLMSCTRYKHTFLIDVTYTNGEQDTIKIDIKNHTNNPNENWKSMIYLGDNGCITIPGVPSYNAYAICGVRNFSIINHNVIKLND